MQLDMAPSLAVNYAAYSKEMPSRIRLGVDIGRVILTADTDDPAKSIFGPLFLESPAVEDSFESIRILNNSPAVGRIFVVSKCGPKVEERTKQWLDAHDFYARTGIDPGDVFFCRERWEKGLIASHLVLTHFIDDRIDVLEALPASVQTKILFGQQKDKRAVTNKGVLPAETWQDALLVLSNGIFRRNTGNQTGRQLPMARYPFKPLEA